MMYHQEGAATLDAITDLGVQHGRVYLRAEPDDVFDVVGNRLIRLKGAHA